MTGHSRGEQTVKQLIDDGRLQRISGAAANGTAWLERARRILHSAEAVATDDPDSAYVLAYDAARHAGTALLVQQGLRPTTLGGHYVVEKAIRAQFGAVFQQFGTLRRRRNELEYPTAPGAESTARELREAFGLSAAIIDAATAIMPELRTF